MKNTAYSIIVCSVLLTLSGCTLIPTSTPQPARETPPQVTTPTSKTPPTIPTNTSEQPKAPTAESPLVTTTTSYHGSYFDIAYPSNFTARPTTPTNTIDGFTNVVTDEAYFTSPDNSVEFFIFSPQWAGEPKDYLNVGKNETLVSETADPSATSDKVVSWGTVKATDGSYFRAWESTRDQITIGSETHKVFGIKYKDDAAYKKYKAQYLAFKKSLEQFAD